MAGRRNSAVYRAAGFMGSAGGAAATAWLEAQEVPCTGLEATLRAALSRGARGREAGMSHCFVLVPPTQFWDSERRC